MAFKNKGKEDKKEEKKEVSKASSPTTTSSSTGKEIAKDVGLVAIGAALAVLTPRLYEALWGENS